MIQFQCPQCGHQLQAPEAAQGRAGRCNQCGTKVAVPTAKPFSEDDVVAWLSSPANDQKPAESQTPDAPPNREVPPNRRSQPKEKPRRDSSPAPAKPKPPEQPNGGLSSPEDEYALSPEADVPKLNTVQLSQLNLSESCQYCGRNETEQQGDRLWCKWCENWAKHRGTNGRVEEEKDLFQEAMTPKHLTAFAAGALVNRLVGPIWGYALYEWMLKDRPGEKPPAKPTKPSKPQSTTQEQACAGCGIVVENSFNCTCPRCGHVEWGVVYVPFLLAACLFIAAMVAFFTIDDVIIRFTIGLIAASIGLFFVLFAAMQVVAAKGSERIRAAYERSLARQGKPKPPPAK